MAAKSAEAQQFLREMEEELASNAEATGISLAFSASERETLGNVANLIDRKVELRKLYDEADGVRVKVALSTEIRLTEGAITRLLKTVDMCAPEAEEDEPMSPTQVKAQRAAQSRWKRERMRKRAQRQQYSGA